MDGGTEGGKKDKLDLCICVEIGSPVEVEQANMLIILCC